MKEAGVKHLVDVSIMADQPIIPSRWQAITPTCQPV